MLISNLVVIIFLKKLSLGNMQVFESADFNMRNVEIKYIDTGEKSV